MSEKAADRGRPGGKFRPTGPAPANRYFVQTSPGHTFARFAPQETRSSGASRLTSIEGLSMMGDPAAVLIAFDRLCGQVAAALQHAQPQVYAGIALAVVLGMLLFPPKDDPDQI
jgi:hypothetical protein